MMQTADKAQVRDCLNGEVYLAYLAMLYSETQDTNNRTPTQKHFTKQLHHFNKNSIETRKTVPGGILDTKKA